MLDHVTSNLLPAATALGTGLAGVISYAYLAPASRLFLPVVSRGHPGTRSVALTFDDGPTPDGTGPILDALAAHQVQAAFFVIGANVERYPDMVRRINAEGHLVCNHSYNHQRLGAIRSSGYWCDEIVATDLAIERVIGKRPALFRAPMGHKSPSMREPLQELCKTPIGWTRRAFDGISVAPRSIVARLSRAGAGEVLLLHDGREPGSARDPRATIEATPRVIEAIRAKGLTFSRLDGLLGLEPYLAVRTPLIAAMSAA